LFLKLNQTFPFAIKQDAGGSISGKVFFPHNCCLFAQFCTLLTGKEYMFYIFAELSASSAKTFEQT
jgi:hypothetical protein